VRRITTLPSPNSPYPGSTAPRCRRTDPLRESAALTLAGLGAVIASNLLADEERRFRERRELARVVGVIVADPTYFTCSGVTVSVRSWSVRLTFARSNGARTKPVSTPCTRCRADQIAAERDGSASRDRSKVSEKALRYVTVWRRATVEAVSVTSGVLCPDVVTEKKAANATMSAAWVLSEMNAKWRTPGVYYLGLPSTTADIAARSMRE